jgi:hypothetical protein
MQKQSMNRESVEELNNNNMQKLEEKEEKNGMNGSKRRIDLGPTLTITKGT